MKKLFYLTLILMLFSLSFAFGQNGTLNYTSDHRTDVMHPELLWKLGRVSAVGLTKDGKSVVYAVSVPDLDSNKFNTTYYLVSVKGGESKQIEQPETLVKDKNISRDGQYKIYDKTVKLQKILGKDLYPELTQSTARVYNELSYRHWDSWSDGAFRHIFLKSLKDTSLAEVDIMVGEPFDCPRKTWGDDQDYSWSPDARSIVYVCKKMTGTDAAISTNTDLYLYDIYSQQTFNLTENNPGYDLYPSFNQNGDLAYLSMVTDGYEADKQNLKVLFNNIPYNLTGQWDGTVEQYIWAKDGKRLFFTAPVDGTIQLFEVDFPGITKKNPVVQQLTKGEFDVTSIIGETEGMLIVTRTDMNTAAELFTYDLKNKLWNQLTFVNKKHYDSIRLSKVERRYVTTTDGKEMLVWVIYPPDFDPDKKYPTLLYCQGGPQSALSQFYSFRWNFQVMAGQGYIVVAPSRRGMPGFGVEWNKQISGDWGGQNMKDYLSAIDALAKEPWIDAKRIGAVGASYGGYSVFYLAGIHQNRFKTFISHNGVFNLQSMYGTTEEVFFPNFDFGGPYWNKETRRVYTDFNPVNFVQNWNTPIMIIQNELDYRVPVGQGMEAFQAAQLRGIRSRLLSFPDENHFVLKPQNGLTWQREFFRWLKETL
ncbi:MAG TPA: S9 family peptidase [Saprospiraceae bacterium]|nr:S9 family peptidase [Saprospiraceae bacterium]